MQGNVNNNLYLGHVKFSTWEFKAEVIHRPPMSLQHFKL